MTLSPAPTASATLTLRDVEDLARIIASVRAQQHVVREVDDNLIGGTLRSFQRDWQVLAHADDNPLGLFVWVTTDTGFEAQWTVPAMLEDLRAGRLALDYRN